jgi:heterodisulfide reductase subunit A
MQVKIGLFLCNCGESLKNIDLPKIRGILAKLEDIAFVDISHNLCLEEGEKAIASRILRENVNRVVIAACSPELYEDKFMRLLEGLGLNPNLLSIANIREQCSWAHEGDVTEKALELIRMAVNKARLLQAVERGEVPVNKEVLVVGGGFSGMKSALELSQLGIRTTMVERESTLGGKLRELGGFYGVETSPKEMLGSMIKAIEEDKNIEVLTSTEVARVQGKVGDFAVRIRKGGKEFSRSFGAIIFATEYRTEILPKDFELKPGGNIIPQQKLVEMLQAPDKLERRPETIGFALDFSDENSRLPTLSTLKNALAVKEKLGSEVYVFCKNLKVDSEGAEKLYREARDRGVVFLKFEEKPRIYGEDGRVKVKARDVLLGEEATFLCDLLVAEEKALPPEGTKALSSMLNIGTDFQGFYQDENVHLFPVASGRKGMFFVGGCRGNLDLSRALTDIASAVMSIHELLSPGEAMVEVEKVKADPQKCRACLTCIRICPHKAIQLVRVDSEKWVAKIYDLACDRCGICAAICPAKAIKLEGYSNEQILAEVEAIGEGL